MDGVTEQEADAVEDSVSRETKEAVEDAVGDITGGILDDFDEYEQFYEDLFEQQRETCREYEDFLEELRELQREGMGEGLDIPLPDSSMKDAVGDAVAEDGGNTIKSGKETKLFLPDEYYQKLDDNIAKAIEARDAEVVRIKGLSKTQQSNIATVVAGVDIRTGEVCRGKNSRVYKGNATCAENIVFRGLGGNTNAKIIMTPAIRPRNNEVIPVCTRCQTKYPKNQCVKGTTFQ